MRNDDFRGSDGKKNAERRDDESTRGDEECREGATRGATWRVAKGWNEESERSVGKGTRTSEHRGFSEWK